MLQFWPGPRGEWIPALSFVGALVGAAIPAWVSLRGQRQDARSEWRQRLDQAMKLATSDTDAERQIGDELLTDLIESDLGTEADRALARRVALIRVSQQMGESPVVVVDADGTVGDNGRNEQEATP